MHDYATVVAPQFPTVDRDIEPPPRLSVEQYQELIGAGIVGSDEPVELLEGLLIKKMTKYPPHVYETR